MFASNYSTLRSFRGGQDGGTKLTRKNVTSNVTQLQVVVEMDVIYDL